MSKAKILIVEDEAITAMDIQKRLEKLSYEVVGTAFSGEEAIHLTEKQQPDLILMDIILKGKMTGLDAARIIIHRFDIPIIYLTAYSDKETVDIAKKTLPYGYITKPFDTNDLQIAVDLALYKKNMEQKFVQADERYRMLMQNVNHAIFILSQQGIVVEVNKALEALLGLERTAIVGTLFANFITTLDVPDFNRQIQNLDNDEQIGPNRCHVKQAKTDKVFECQYSAVCKKVGSEVLILGVLTEMSTMQQVNRATMTPA